MSDVCISLNVVFVCVINKESSGAGWLVVLRLRWSSINYLSDYTGSTYKKKSCNCNALLISQRQKQDLPDDSLLISEHNK